MFDTTLLSRAEDGMEINVKRLKYLARKVMFSLKKSTYFFLSKSHYTDT